MRTRVLLNLEGKHCFVGLLSADRMGALFQYAPEFVADGLEVSPLSCPLRASVFRGIPGFVSDSLPDVIGKTDNTVLMVGEICFCLADMLVKTGVLQKWQYQRDSPALVIRAWGPWNSSRKRRTRKNLVVTTAATALISMPLPSR